MSEYFISNKYIYLYIYICLFHFVANKEKFFLRFDNGEQKEEREFKLDLETEGGKTLYDRLKKDKKIELKMAYVIPSLLWNEGIDTNFISFLETPPSGRLSFGLGDMVASKDDFFIALDSIDYDNAQKIGNLIETENFSYQNLLKFEINENNDFFIKVKMIYESDEIIKKIIRIFIFGLSILIILFIIKSIL